MATGSCKVTAEGMRLEEGGLVLSGQESDERSQTRGLAGVGALAGPRLTECHRGRGEPDEEDVGDLSYTP